MLPKKGAIESLGYLDKKEKYQNAAIKLLSEKQKEMRMKTNTVNDLEKRQQLRHERNHIVTEIHDLIRVEETNKVDAIL